MDVKYQVFVSSTYEDLQEERRAVIAAILAMGHIPVGMEAFNASDEDQWTNIKRRIDKADYYVVIVAERYGAEKDGKSYTQMEYEYAVEKEVPVAAFLLHKDARRIWPNHKIESGKEKKVEAFRKLCQNKMVSFWASAGELSGAVVLSLTELIQLRPRVGWVRSNSVPTSTVMNELAALSEDKRQLLSRVEELSSNDTLKIPDDILWRLGEFKQITLNKLMDMEEPLPSLLEAYLFMAEFLEIEFSAENVKDQLEAITNRVAENEDAEKYIKILLQNNLIEPLALPPTNWQGARYIIKQYHMTAYGKEFLMYGKAWAPELRF